MKATEQYFAVVLFIILYKMVLMFESGGYALNEMKILSLFFAWHGDS